MDDVDGCGVGMVGFEVDGCDAIGRGAKGCVDDTDLADFPFKSASFSRGRFRFRSKGQVPRLANDEAGGGATPFNTGGNTVG